MPAYLRQRCQSFQCIRLGCCTSPSLIASSKFRSLLLICRDVISRNHLISRSSPQLRWIARMGSCVRQVRSTADNANVCLCFNDSQPAQHQLQKFLMLQHVRKGSYLSQKQMYFWLYTTRLTAVALTLCKVRAGASQVQEK